MMAPACRALLFLLWFLPLGALASWDTLEGDPALRRTFLEGVQALERGESRAYRRARRRLQQAHSPLLPWLEEKALGRRLARLGDEEILAFLEHAAGTPPGERFRRRLLGHLARTGQWRRFLRYRTPSGSVHYQCYELRARLHVGPPDTAWFARALALWNVGHSQPDACDPVFARLYAAGRITPQRRWERIEKAMQSGHVSLARWLARGLPADQQRWVRRWILAHRHPERALRAAWMQPDTPLARKLALHAVSRLARRDPDRAYRYLVQAALLHTFDEADYYRVLGRIALQAARQGDPVAYTWLGQIPPAQQTPLEQAWRARVALMHEDWPRVRAAIRAMAPALREEPQWQYWLASADAALGRQRAARARFARLADKRNYHGFLAAEALGRPFRFHHRAIPAKREELRALLRAHPLLAAARDFYRIGWIKEARRAWLAGTASLSPRGLQLAAVLAHRLGWHDRAILTAARSGYLDDLEIRFPLAHRREVERQARRTGLDATWVYGIVRQESAFMLDARSRAGALGLMQLLPSTGRRLARLLRQRTPSRHSLLHPRVNLRLGTAYLRRLLERFGNQALASAAYNAGPDQLRRWLRLRGPHQDPRIVIDTLPYAETRGYVRAVLAFATVYRHRLGLRPVRIAYRLGLDGKRLAARLDPHEGHPTDSLPGQSASFRQEGSHPWTEASSASSAAPVSSAVTSLSGWHAKAIACASPAAARIATGRSASSPASP